MGGVRVHFAGILMPGQKGTMGICGKENVLTVMDQEKVTCQQCLRSINATTGWKAHKRRQVEIGVTYEKIMWSELKELVSKPVYGSGSPRTRKMTTGLARMIKFIEFMKSTDPKIVDEMMKREGIDLNS